MKKTDMTAQPPGRGVPPENLPFHVDRVTVGQRDLTANS